MTKFTVTINEKKQDLTAGTTVFEAIQNGFGDVKQYVNCSVNNRIRELNYPLNGPADIILYTKKDQFATKTYETSLRYLICMAASRALPEYKIKLSYNISRSIFVTLSGTENEHFDDEKMAKLEAEMRRIASQNLPIERSEMTKEDAEKYYLEHNMTDKIPLLRYRPEAIVHLNLCDGYANYMYGHNVPTTGVLDEFRLTLFDGGVLVQYPRSELGGEIPAFSADEVYHKVLKECYKKFRQMKTDTIAGINKRVENDGPIDFVNMCEAYQSDMFSDLGDALEGRENSPRLICIAGPSSSGKTTFSNRLRVELMARGMTPLRISLDDYYIPREKIPLDEEGKPDFETIEALDTERFASDVKRLIAGETVTLPRFDFQLGHAVDGRTISLEKGEPIIVEGIHALNPRITIGIDRSNIFRIFIAPTAQINFDNHTPISLTDLRMLRRIVRDSQFRGTPATKTIDMWPSVRRGEFKWIYATQENADFVFNSFLPYELCVMKKYAMPLLDAIPKDAPQYPMANRLQKFLKNFIDLDDAWVPHNSILREFIGGSCFADV